MRWIASQSDGVVHGFDSFEGIQEHWNGNPIGAFAQKRMPKVPDNVEFHVGYFDATLPDFLAVHADPVAFLHVDCDLYSSTVTIFEPWVRDCSPVPSCCLTSTTTSIAGSSMSSRRSRNSSLAPAFGTSTLLIQ